jgi:hypothetical protein
VDQERKKSANGRPAKPAEAKRQRATRTLPTERVAAAKQLDILRAYAIASGPGAKPVQVIDAAGIVKMAGTTVSLCSAFFKDTGFLTRTNEGQLLPSPEVMEFNRAYEWNPATAAYKLAPLLEKTWFGEALLPKVKFSPMSQEEAIGNLGTAAAAAADSKPNLLILLDFMEVAGLINRENGQVSAGSAPTAPAARPEARPSQSTEAPAADREVHRDQPARLATSFTQQEGVIQFHISVKVNMGEFAGWEPARINAFFGGIAQVLAAKGDVEEDAGGQT